MSKGYPMGTTLQGLFNDWINVDPETRRTHLCANGFKDYHVSSLIKGSIVEKIVLMLAGRIEKETGINMRDLSVARAKTALWGDTGDELPDFATKSKPDLIRRRRNLTRRRPILKLAKTTHKNGKLFYPLWIVNFCYTVQYPCAGASYSP